MNPVAIEIFGISIRWYGILMALAMLSGSMVMMHLAKKKGYKENDLYDLLLIVLIFSVLGSRLYYVVFNWGYYSANPSQILNFRGGGMAIHGGIIFGLISGYIFTKIKKINFYELADIAAPGLILGQAIGRWGNFANGEAHGGPTDLPWGIMVDGIKVHPTFLYESLWNLMVFGVLLWYLPRRKFDGEGFLLYGILYSIGRFFIEGMRTDSLMLGSFRMAQVISIVTIIIFSGVILYVRKRMERVKGNQ
ncbi:MAG: prolipoprotein diacylglyceryl transferase [Clostridiales bacterium]|nr:prolipoprotein diacylglyceryl transferase [Clostridiales bacterium]